ncbi:MBOAT family O-acyltransferase [Leptospira bouyouniensis]|uniref:MBOAT family protein n=1 Tax=Leptospira bouyouniensis TaxID=2484911 RepID=A0ABY2L1G3_9LEPT|nr:MBOAT family O-acyltransferase [Leptospira bouyouniensis]TGK46731.1 MBOAT family protein [Leptospira bouyouniensis]
MLFNSLNFLLYFFVFYLIYYFSPFRIRKLLLLFFGIYFYSQWSIGGTILLFSSILFNYTIGILIDKIPANKKRPLFIFGITANVLYLAIFKYFLFVWGVLSDLRIEFGESPLLWKPNILLPIGISFYTFHNISYLIEVYDKKIPVCRNFFTFVLYDMFFPLLLLGPIERPGNLIPQIESERFISKDNIWNGLSLFCFGVFIKSSIADPLSRYVGIQVGSFLSLEPGILWIVAPTIAFQVYADFFGYSLCAMGLAEMLGFELMNNFKRPFFSSNPSEFWSKWHISLSTWLRDYVYIKLGGNRHGFVRENINLMFVWFLTGIWHGAGYGFIIWGFYLGICLVLYRILKHLGLTKLQNKVFTGIGILFTFYTFSIGLLLFRINSPKESLLILENLRTFPSWNQIPFMLLLIILPLFLFDLWQEWKQTDRPTFFVTTKPYLFSVILVLSFFWFSLVSPFAKEDFFYFQF